LNFLLFGSEILSLFSAENQTFWFKTFILLPLWLCCPGLLHHSPPPAMPPLPGRRWFILVTNCEIWWDVMQPLTTYGKNCGSMQKKLQPLPNVRTEDSSICGEGHVNFVLISVDCCYWCSRTLTSPSIQSSIVGPSETFMPLSRDNVLACSWGALSCCMMNTYPHVAHTLCWTIPCTAWTV
jgi:hypothetical protein